MQNAHALLTENKVNMFTQHSTSMQYLHILLVSLADLMAPDHCPPRRRDRYSILWTPEDGISPTISVSTRPSPQTLPNPNHCLQSLPHPLPPPPAGRPMASWPQRIWGCTVSLTLATSSSSSSSTPPKSKSTVGVCMQREGGGKQGGLAASYLPPPHRSAGQTQTLQSHPQSLVQLHSSGVHTPQRSTEEISYA